MPLTQAKANEIKESLERDSSETNVRNAVKEIRILLNQPSALRSQPNQSPITAQYLMNTVDNYVEGQPPPTPSLTQGGRKRRRSRKTRKHLRRRK